jgi:uncharacterized protein (TIGR02284 family)
MATTMEKATETLNSLLRGELSAVETYDQALKKVVNEPGAHALTADTLSTVRRDHTEAVSVLREHVIRYGGRPTDGSGPWGAFARFIQGTAKIFGDKSALKALKEGEEHGLKDYNDALEKRDLPSECIELIRSLLPRQQEHIMMIDGMMQTV